MPNEFQMSVISKPPEKRQDEEIRQLVPWLRSKAKLFKGIQADILADIIRNCRCATKERDEIVIMQGEIGDCFYVTLTGKVSIYIFNKDQVASDTGGGGNVTSTDTDEGESDAVSNIIHYNQEGVLDRSRLGNWVISLGAGAPIGDVALTSGDSIRTASIVADIRTDLLVVDRALYNRSFKGFLAKEFTEKTTFIKNNPLFSTWPAKYRKQLAMALYKETFGYESQLTRQGDRTSDMYFILSGQVEIQMDTGQHKQQYPQYFQAAKENVVDRLIRKSQKPTQHREQNLRNQHAQHTQRTNGVLSKHRNLHSANAKRKESTSRRLRLCSLGVNESVGDVELTMSLPTYVQTAVCRETTEVLVLEGKHYDRLFVRRHPRTIETMRDQIGVKVESRLSMIHHKAEVPFLDHLKSVIASRHKPAPQVESKDQPSVSMAEKEFLNHKGPLIDQHGPGSVFYLIKLREVTRMRLRAKRGERAERIREVNRRSLPNSMLVAAANQIHSLPEETPSHMRPVSSIGGYDNRHAHHALSYRGLQNAWREAEEEQEQEEEEERERERERERRLHQEGVEEDEGVGVVSEVVENGGGEAIRQEALVEDRIRHVAVQEQEEEDIIHSYRSLSSRSPDQEGAEEQDLRLSVLEEKVRRWLQADNPKGKKPHVAQLRRLPIEEMEFQPRPGNKVYVRKRDNNRKLDSQNTMLSLDRTNTNMTTTGYKHNSNNTSISSNNFSKSPRSVHNASSISLSPRVKKTTDLSAYSVLLSR